MVIYLYSIIQSINIYFFIFENYEQMIAFLMKFDKKIHIEFCCHKWWIMIMNLIGAMLIKRFYKKSKAIKKNKNKKKIVKIQNYLVQKISTTLLHLQ